MKCMSLKLFSILQFVHLGQSLYYQVHKIQLINAFLLPVPVGEVEAPEVVEGGGSRCAAAKDVHGEGGVVIDRGVTENGKLNP